jgi:hypothetical protein
MAQIDADERDSSAWLLYGMGNGDRSPSRALAIPAIWPSARALIGLAGSLVRRAAEK